MATGGKTASAKTKNGTKSKPKRPVTGGDMDRRWAILLFGLGLLFFVLAVVPGENGWAWIRSNILFGTFGVSGWLIGPMLVWWAVLVSLEKPVFGPIIKSVIFLFVLSGVVLVFSPIDFTDLTFGEVLAALLESGRSGPFGGGLISLIFGASLLAFTGRVAARILIILLLLIAAMVLTGVTPGDIARFFGRLGDKVADRMDRAYEDLPEPEDAPAPPQAVQAVPAKPAPAARRGNAPQASLSAPARRMTVVDIPIDPAQDGAAPPAAGRQAQPARRRSAVDIDLGPEGPASVPGVAPTEPVEIGPGGTFGLNPLGGNNETGLGDDYEPLIPFRPTPASLPDEPAPDGSILLFGEDDPYANLGGAESKLPPGTALDVEYIPPPDHCFDLFGAGPGAHSAAPHDPAPIPQAAAPQPAMPPQPPMPAGQPAPAAPAKTQGTVWDAPAGAGDAPFELNEDSAWQRGQARERGPIEPPPSTLLQNAGPGGFGTAGAQAPQSAAASGEPSVDELIDKATPKGEAQIAADTREQQDVVEPYHFPPIDTFDRPPPETTAGAKEEMKRTADLLVGTLSSFGVETRILDISRGPSVTRYEVQPQAGVKISRITNLSDDIALNLAAAGVRIEAPIPGKPAVGIEVPNKVKSTVSIRSILESGAFAGATSPLSIALGKDIAGENVVADLTKMPHLLIAGSTGSGKSVCVNSIIMSFLYKSAPEDVKMILIDPKVVELAEYNGIPHLLIPVVTEPKMAAKALGQAVVEMENRYHLFAEHGVRDIGTFNKLAKRDGTIEKMPHIAIIIDELADLMMTAGKDVENYICRIAQKARAAGMHLIVATQRPSVDVITGLIKSNIPSRIAFAVSSQVDSRTILDGAGAEKLLGMGDMLFMPIGANKPVRVQGTYVKDKEISAVLRYVKNNGAALYDDAFLAEMDKVQLSGAAKGGDAADDEETGDLIHDPVFQSAVETVIEAGQASTSYLQRRLRLGYARAGRIMDQMERMGIISEPDGSKPRKLLITRQQWQEMIMNATD